MIIRFLVASRFASLITMVLAAASLSATNLLKNPSFENFDQAYAMPTHWSHWGEGEFYWHGDDSHTGLRSMNLGGKEDALIFQAVEAPGKQGIEKTVDVKVWAKHFKRDSEDNRGQIKIEFWKQLSDPAPKKEVRLAVEASSDWAEYNLNTTAPSGTAFMTVGFLVFKGSKVMFDDASLQVHEEEEVEYDLTKSSHPFSGFGTQLWAYEENPYNLNHSSDRIAALKEMNIQYVRIEHYCDTATWEELAHLREETDKLGIQWIYVIWRSKDLPSKVVDSEDSLEKLTGEWMKIVTSLYQHGIPIEYIELMNEPDSKGDWSTGIAPYWYNKALSVMRKKLDDYGLSQVGIVGPGLSDMKQSSAYLSVISEENAKNALAAWSTHQWGGIEANTPYRNGAPSLEYWWEKEFEKPTQEKNSQLPIFVTEFSSDIRSIDGTKYDPDNFGIWNESWHTPNFSVANTMPFAARTYENALAFLNKGANAALFWQLTDEWPETSLKSKSWGFLDLWGREKPVYFAMKSLAQKLQKGSFVLASPEQKFHELYTGAFLTPEGKIVIAISNTTEEEHSTTVTLKNAPHGLQVKEALAFVIQSKGDPSQGMPDEGMYLLHDDLQIKDNNRLKVTLPASSVLTVVLDARKK